MIRRSILGLFLALLLSIAAAGVLLAAVGDHVDQQDFDLDSGNNPSGITWDGSHFRVVSETSRKVYAHNSSGAYVSTQDFNLATGNVSPAGITWDGTYLGVVDFAGTEKVYTYNSSGTYVSTQDFNLATGNDDPAGITWDGTYLRVVNNDTDKVYTYTSSGTHVSTQDFNLVAGNDQPKGITWDGTYFRVSNNDTDKVYTYTSSGTHVSTQDFNLVSANNSPIGIAWDGIYLRVIDNVDRKSYAYEGLPQGPFPNHGIPDDTEYAALFAETVATRGDWLCAQSTSGESYRANNAQLTVHGFCAKEEGSGISVEIHLGAGTSYASLSRFVNVTGPWWFVESGAAAQLGQRIYDDTPKDTDELAFTEELGGLEDSNRLGFSTVAKLVTDDDCTEDAAAGFECTVANLDNLAADDTAVLGFGLSDKNNIEFADMPTTPDSITVSRSDDYTVATTGWTLYDAATEYQIERVVAVQVDVGDASRIEYGDPLTFRVNGTQAGINEYEDNTIQAPRTYQYRLRARGAEDTSWSAWSDYVFSGAISEADIPTPSNLELTRDTGSITASWGAPTDGFDAYTLQRQELLAVDGSSFFGNVVTFGDMWLSSTSTMYVDNSVVPDQTYEYRVAAVLNDQVGEYSDWFRIGPLNLSLGGAPNNFMLIETGARQFDERYEYWMDWDDVGRANDYEVQVVSYELDGRGQSMETHVVTDSTFFNTAFNRNALRVRGRQLDAVTCAAALDNRCVTEWTAWYGVRFTPVMAIPSPPMVETPATSTMELREGVENVLAASLGPLGTTIDTSTALEGLVLVATMMIGSASIVVSWRRGMGPLGVGMAVAVSILILFAGYRLLGTAVAWPVAAQSLLAVLGMLAVARQFWDGQTRLLKILVVLVVIHLGFGFTQLSVSYFAGDIADHGAAGLVSHTPLGEFIDLEATPQSGTEQTNVGNLARAFDLVNNTGDMINGLATFGYGFLTDIEPNAGFVYQVVIAFRILSALLWIGLGLSLLYILFDSNLLTSKFGLAILGLGAGLGGLSLVGALTGG